MAGEWTTERFPQFAEPLRRLTEQHRELKDEPLHLAVAFQPDPPRDQQDIYLLEVVGGWSEDNPDKELFETTFEPDGRLRTGFEQRLHLILTTPQEIETALNERWESVEEIVRAVRADDFQAMYRDEVGERVLAWIEKAARSREAARRG